MADWLITDEPDPLDWPAPARVPTSTPEPATPKPAPAPEREAAPAPEREAPALKDLVALVRAELGLGLVAEVEESLA